MSDRCAFTSAEEPTCELSSLPNKPFCSKHTVKAGTLEEMQQVNKTKLRTKAVLKNPNTLPQELDPEVAALQSAEAEDDCPETIEEALQVPDRVLSREPDDPEVFGSKLAEQLVQAEMEDRMTRFGIHGGRNRGSTKKVPFKFSPRRVRPDATCILDPVTGENPVPKGWVARWVREKDHLDRPNAQRAIEFGDYGYKPVKDRNGKIIKSNLGVAMMAPPQQYALRVKEKAPLGGVTREGMLEYAEEAVRDGNKQAGVKAARVYVDEDNHGSERFVHEASA
jgi:hypothetical protein